jgi:DNA-binding CsgD family transcriptional regulator
MEGKMTVRNEPAVLIIDALSLRSLGLVSTLNRLDDLATSPKGSVNLHTSDEAEPGMDADANYQMLIYIAGGETARQKAVLELLRRGDTNKGIARRLGMREGTVKVHVRQIMRKFGVTNRTQVAVVCAKGRHATPAEF